MNNDTTKCVSEAARRLKNLHNDYSPKLQESPGPIRIREGGLVLENGAVFLDEDAEKAIEKAVTRHWKNVGPEELVEISMARIPGMNRMPGVAQSSPREQEQVIEEMAVRDMRPALLIKNGDYELSGAVGMPPSLKTSLSAARQRLTNDVIGAVGRIEVRNHHKWTLGTGFIVEPPGHANHLGRDSFLVITNQHVAREIAYRKQDGDYQFVPGLEADKTVQPFLDLKEEHQSNEEAEFSVVRVIHIEDAPGPDVAILEVKWLSIKQRPQFKPLVMQPDVKHLSPIAAIGYPMFDTRANDAQTVLRILGNVYDKKRLSPGLLIENTIEKLRHDCSTFGGNSGSPLINLAKGTVAGLHAGGMFPAINYGVSSNRIIDLLKKHVLTTSVPVSDPGIREQPVTASTSAAVQVIVNESAMVDGHLQIPITLSLDLNSIQTSSASQANERIGIRVNGMINSGDALGQAVLRARRDLSGLPGVVNVRDGIEIVGDQFGAEAIVVLVDTTQPGLDETKKKLPSQFQGFPVQVRNVSLSDLLDIERTITEAVPRIRYREPEISRLSEVDEEMFAVFHVSPDAGWPELRNFLSRIENSLTLGLYNFSTNHIKELLLEVLERENANFQLVLGRSGIDRPHIDEFEENFLEEAAQKLGSRFSFQTAESRGRRLFAGHYHIKVAVRDGNAIWLSSGNWDHSNQPEVDPIASGEQSIQLLNEKNREWHAVVLNEKLAEIFEFYIQHDFEQYSNITESTVDNEEERLFLVPFDPPQVEESTSVQAKYFEPLVVNKRLRIQPLLSPDNFLENTKALIEEAEESILIQNQNFTWKDRSDDKFKEFAQAILDKSRSGVSVRIILRSDFGTEHKESLIRNGFEESQIQVIKRCHTKGMVVDGKTVLLGSHNWTDHGALGNRDASLIVRDTEVAEYYRDLFDYDWLRSSPRVTESAPGIRRFRLGDEIPDGFRVVSEAEI